MLAAALLLVAANAATADAARFLPPAGKIWHGVSDTGDVRDYRRFNRQIRAHTPLLQNFFHWGVPLTTGALERWRRTKTRGVLSLSTAPGSGAEVITPKEIAHGRGDHYLIRLNQSIAKSGQVVYIRPFAEMNLHINPYSAFNWDGTRRPGHSTKAFIRSWRRLALIVRGGSRARINRRLVRNGMPRIHRAKGEKDPIYKELGVPDRLNRPKVALMWMPLTRGSPNVPGNAPRDYWPGKRFVDWVGTDAYAKFSNRTLWTNLRAFYRSYRGFPFAIGEYGPWDNDYRGQFVSKLHKWARKRKRVRALIYFRSNDRYNEFNLQHYQRARVRLRHILNRARYAEFAPGVHNLPEPPKPGPEPGPDESGGVTP